MLQLVRKVIGSRLGALGAIAFLVLIALAFAGSDIANFRHSGTAQAGDGVANVGGREIDAATLVQAARAALDTVKQQQPAATMAQFLAAGGLSQVLDNQIDRVALQAWGEKHAVVASDRLIDSEIAKTPVFQGPDGRFSQALFDQLIRARGINQKQVRDEIAQSLIARQMLVPAGLGASVPRSVATRYAELLKETRVGAIAALPSSAFVPATRPDEATLAAWYQGHRASFTRPERRTIRYAVLDEAALKVPAPSDAAIAARYQANAGAYAALETRAFTQLIVAGESDARAVAAEVAAGKSLAAVAQARGLATSVIGPIGKAAFAAQTGPAVADAAFAAPRGALAGLARSALGWYLVRVDAVATRPARTLAQARGEIAAALAAEARRKALSDASSRIEDLFDSGGGLADAAKTYGLALAETAPLTADGRVYGKPTETAPPVLAKVLQAAFAMDQEHQPQLAESEPGKQVVLFEASRIAASAPAPYAEIRDDVATAYLLTQGFAAASDAAGKVLAASKAGGDLGKAIAGLAGSLGRPLPPVQAVTMTREQLAQLQQQSRGQAPQPLLLLFSMAQGTTKLLPAPGDRGWFVVGLKTITPGTLAANDPQIEAARHDLGALVGDEYAAALRRAIRDEVGVKRNPGAVAAVARQLGGGGAAEQ